MIRYKVTTGDRSVQVEFESMSELFQYLAYEEEIAEKKEVIRSIPMTEWESPID